MLSFFPVMARKKDNGKEKEKQVDVFFIFLVHIYLVCIRNAKVKFICSTPPGANQVNQNKNICTSPFR